MSKDKELESHKIRCPYCGGEVMDFMDQCPHCHQIMPDNNEELRHDQHIMKMHRRSQIISVLCFIGVFIYMLIRNSQ